ncbi:hypothetical protein DFH07DRAFT_936516 [Mycena maculata]|uniref:Uncharacterized protein n=1 Tax=Mycena maculata TaxID=230809 RepID=A0AAD7K3Z0_9AGAR|nr:hypothetical protein DFH07DRAFT_936516 [Mycena maculata]
MPYPMDLAIRAAITASISTLRVTFPGLQDEHWEAIEAEGSSTGESERETCFVQGLVFLHSEFADSLFVRVFRPPVGCCEIIQAALFSRPTFAALLARANIQAHPDKRTYHAFIVYVGAAARSKSLGAATMKTWFQQTFAPLVAPAEAAYVKSLAPPEGDRPPKRYRSRLHYTGCKSLLADMRAKQTRATKHATQRHPPRPRGLLSSCLFHHKLSFWFRLKRVRPRASSPARPFHRPRRSLLWVINGSQRPHCPRLCTSSRFRSGPPPFSRPSRPQHRSVPLPGNPRNIPNACHRVSSTARAYRCHSLAAFDCCRFLLPFLS